MSEQFDFNESVSIYFRELEIVESLMTKVGQFVQLFKHPQLGKILVINNEIQHVQNWQFLYHESLVHLPCAFVEIPRNGLILGGGSLFAAYELLKYNSIEKVVLIDHDIEVVELMQKHYPHVDKVLKNPLFEMKNYDFTKNILEKTAFDIIINDSIDLHDSHKSGNFHNSYKILIGHLSEIGVCSDLIYRHIFVQKATMDTIDLIRKEKNIVMSLITVPEYPGVLHLLTIFGNSKHLSQTMKETKNSDQKKWKKTNINEYYDPNFMEYYLYLPPFIRNKFK